MPRWVNPGDLMFITLQASDQKARFYKRVEGHPTLLVTSATALSLVTNNWYTGKVVIDDDPGNSALQRLRFWVDTDDDADFSDETELMGGSGTTTIDDVWSGGYAGLYRGGGASQQYDDFKVGYDNNADGDFDDGGDVIAIEDDFASNTLNLSYDANGNLTNDGIFQFTYDAWNRLRLAKLVVGTDETTIGDYEYYGDTRRSKKIVSNHGPEVYLNDGGDTETRFYYAGWRPGADAMSRWSVAETRNASNQTVQAMLWGTRYIDELVMFENNGDVSAANDTDPDETAGGESSETPADMRYFVTQDRNWNVVAVTEYDTSGLQNGGVLERAVELSDIERIRLFDGSAGSNERGTLRTVSTIAVPERDARGFPSGYENRQREGIVSWSEAPAESYVRCCQAAGWPGKHCALIVREPQANGQCRWKMIEGTGAVGGGTDGPCTSSNETSGSCDAVPFPPGAQCEDSPKRPISPRSLQCLDQVDSGRFCGKRYNPVGSNSNALVATILECCHVPPDEENGFVFPPTAPGWIGPYGPGNTNGDRPCVNVDPCDVRCAKCRDLGLAY